MDVTIRDCLNCGKKFKATNPKAKFCSDKCKMAKSRALKKTAEKPSKIKESKSADQLKEELPPNSHIIIPNPALQEARDFVNRAKFLPAWVEKVQGFCEKHGITPEDLIDSYMGKTTKKETRKEVKDNDHGSMDYLEQRRKLKNGA